jgi:adenylate cyclase
MGAFLKHWPRIAITLIPLLLGLLHATGVVRLGIIDRLDDNIYDARLRATMPATLDERVVVVDIDEKSLAEVGRWPWGRNRVAELTDRLFDEHKVALLGVDVVFAEVDDSSGLKQLRLLANNELREQPGFVERVAQLQDSLDYDGMLARSLSKRPIVLGYYFTSDGDGRRSGLLPAPAMSPAVLGGREIRITQWNGYGSNIEVLAKAAPRAGFFNMILPSDGDGLVRTVPMLARHNGQYYESLSLAIFRMLTGSPNIMAGFPEERWVSERYGRLAKLMMQSDGRTIGIPVSEDVAVLVPYRGYGGPKGGSFRYVSAADILAGKVPVGSLKDKIMLLGTTAPGLVDLRVTPVGEAYPGVEVHANLISALLDDRVFIKPDYALGYEVLVLALSGLLLAIVLPGLSAPFAVLLSAGVMLALMALNFALFSAGGLVLPLACSLLTAFAAFALNMSYGYFVESRSKRELAQLFGSYVAPELVVEMVKDPASYSMKALSKELTVMFCDMRGFTKMSETMDPLQLQELLNDVFSRLTDIIRVNRGTIDKYMGDCVMAFWGAPVDLPNHAALAVKASIEMATAIDQLNASNRAKGILEIGVGIGLNTGLMCVGDMGSVTRRSYTVIGDAVNLGSRLEGLSKTYGVTLVVSAATRKLATEFAWQELDRVRVKGKQQAVSIYTPRVSGVDAGEDLSTELKTWNLFLQSYRAQQWEQCDVLLLNMQRLAPDKYLYHLYLDRVAGLRCLPVDPNWDGATSFDNK